MQLNCGVSDTLGELEFLELTPSSASTFDRSLAESNIATGNASLVKHVKVPVLTLAEICERYLPGRQIDLLSIDTEGFEIRVLRGMDWSRWKPTLLMVEIKTCGKTSNFAEIEGFLRANYKLLDIVGCNALFEIMQ